MAIIVPFVMASSVGRMLRDVVVRGGMAVSEPTKQTDTNPDKRLKEPGPSPVKIFACGFGVMVLLGGLWMGLKPMGQKFVAACDESFASLKQSVSEMTEFKNEHWWKDRTIYFMVDEDGISLASDDEVSEHKAYEEEWAEAMEHNREVMETYYND